MSPTAKQIIAAATQKAKKIARRVRLLAEIFAIASVLLVTFAAHKGWVTAQFIPPAMAIGAQTETLIAAANDETSQALEAVRHKPIKSADAGPQPGRKPVQ